MAEGKGYGVLWAPGVYGFCVISDIAYFTIVGSFNSGLLQPTCIDSALFSGANRNIY